MLSQSAAPTTNFNYLKKKEYFSYEEPETERLAKCFVYLVSIPTLKMRYSKGSMMLPKIWDELSEFWVPFNFHQVFFCLSPTLKLTDIKTNCKCDATDVTFFFYFQNY